MVDDSPFWTFSLGLYGRPGIADICLRLQEQCQVDVNLLLFLLWAATMRRCLDEADVAALDRAMASWRADVIQPLRGVRRKLKAPPDGLDRDASEALRQVVKGAELEAERLQQEALYRSFHVAKAGIGCDDVAGAASKNLAGYERILNADFGQTARTTLIDELMHEN